MSDVLGRPASLSGVRMANKGPGFIVVRGALSAEAQALAAECFGDLDSLLPPSLSRRAAAGAPDIERIRQVRPGAEGLELVSPTSCRLVVNGKLQKQVISNPVRSYIGGNRWDRFKRTAAPGIVTSRLPERWAAFAPVLQEVSGIYRSEFPTEWAEQMTVGERVFGTPFTTTAINIDYASHYHVDRGDFLRGFSTVSVFGVGDEPLVGGELVFPTLGVAVDLRPGDVCLFKAHELPHGNMPVTSGRRLSVVAYAKEVFA